LSGLRRGRGPTRVGGKRRSRDGRDLLPDRGTAPSHRKGFGGRDRARRPRGAQAHARRDLSAAGGWGGMRRPGWLALALAETRMQVRLLLRNVVAAFFTLVMPLLFLILLNFFIGDGVLSVVSALSNFFSPAIAEVGLMTVTLPILAIILSCARTARVLEWPHRQ